MRETSDSIKSQPTVWLTLPEAAQFARVHKNTVRRAVRRGRLKAFRLNNERDWRFRQQDLDTWLTASPVAPSMVQS